MTTRGTRVWERCGAPNERILPPKLRWQKRRKCARIEVVASSLATQLGPPCPRPWLHSSTPRLGNRGETMAAATAKPPSTETTRENIVDERNDRRRRASASLHVSIYTDYTFSSGFRLSRSSTPTGFQFLPVFIFRRFAVIQPVFYFRRFEGKPDHDQGEILFL